MDSDELKRICQVECGAACCKNVMQHKGGQWIVGRCQYLTDENLCGIYETRPEDCRSFPVGRIANCRLSQIDEWWEQ